MLAAARTSFTNFLTSPSKIALSLDWRKASCGRILSMSIGKDTIDIAVASHPQSNDTMQPLPSIPIQTQVINNKKVLSPSVAAELSKIMSDWKVCGMVVSWPVQKEGWAGAACGRVLFTLDQLSKSAPGTGVINSNRKVCLWNESHHEFCEDNWGRTPVYAQTSDKTIHYASKEQYASPKTLATDVWMDFCRAHWPGLNKYSYGDKKNGLWLSSSKVEKASSHADKILSFDTAWIDDYENTSAYTKATL